MQKFNKSLKIILISFLILSQFIALLMLIWSVFRGFDFTDEGFYLISFQKNYSSPVSATQFYKLVQSFFSIIDLNIINVRFLRLILSAFSSVFLALNLFKFIKIKYKNVGIRDLLIIVLLILTGGLWNFGSGLISLSYNSLSQIFVQIIVGFLFGFLIALEKRNEISIALNLILISIFSVFLIPVKITTFGLVYSLVAAFIVFFPDKSVLFKKRIKYLIILAIGFIFGLLLLSVTVQNVIELLGNIIKGGRALTNTKGYKPGDLFTKLIEFQISSFRLVLLPLFAWSGYFVIQKVFEGKNKQYLYNFLNIGLYILVLWFFVKESFFVGDRLALRITSAPVFQLQIFIYLFPVYRFIRYRNKKEFSMQEIYIAIFLLILPVFAVLGTNNDLFYNALYFVNFWIIISLIIIYKSEFNKMLALSLIIILPLITVYLIYFKRIKHPYRSVDLTMQTHKLHNVKRAKNIKFDLATANFLDSMYVNLKKEGFKRGDDIIGVYKMPGIIYLMEGNAIGGVLWSENNSMKFFENIKTVNLKKMPVFIVKDSVPVNFTEKIKAFKIYFPEEYKKIYQVLYKKHVYKVYFPYSELKSN